MMKVFDRLSIKTKITTVILVTSMVALLVGFSIVIYNDINTFKDDLINNSLLHSRLIGEYLVTPLTFNYSGDAEIVLEKLKTLPSVLNAIVFDENDQRFAIYKEDCAHCADIEPIKDQGYRIEGDILHVYSPIEYQNVHYGAIYLIVTMELLNDKINDYLITMGALAFFLMILSYFFAHSLQGVVSKPILHLAEVTKKISESRDYSMRVKAKGQDEIASLYSGFNNMIEQIHIREQERDQAEHALKNSEEKFRNISEEIMDGVAILIDYKIYWVNDAFTEIFGYAKAELSKKSIDFLILPENLPILKSQMEKALQNTEIIKHYVIRAKRKDERVIFIDIQGKKITYEGNAAIQIVVRDITDRKIAEEKINKLNEELEQRVKLRTEQLELANKELKDFAYVVSHDLKAPLRAISQLASWIFNDYAKFLDDEGREMLNLLVGRAKRMDRLIEGILQYSRIGRVKTKEKSVDLNILVSELTVFIAPPANINIIIENKLPAITIDQTRIEQVFQNLMSNAVKFIDKPNGEIRIGSREEDTYWIFYVKDNGIGIEEKYYDKVFQIFQTLTPRDEKENTGIGLSLVKKIIEMFGGEVWVESKINAGSTFYFTIPKEVINDEEQQ